MCGCVGEQYNKGQVIEGPSKTSALYPEGTREPCKVLSRPNHGCTMKGEFQPLRPEAGRPGRKESGLWIWVGAAVSWSGAKTNIGRGPDPALTELQPRPGQKNTKATLAPHAHILRL